MGSVISQVQWMVPMTSSPTSAWHVRHCAVTSGPDSNGPASDIEIRFTSIDVVGTCASVRLDMDNWTGHRFTDFFNLVKFDGQWKVVSKVFHLHP